VISVKEDFARMIMEIVQEKIKAEQISKMNLTLVDVIPIISILFSSDKNTIF
jgi:membrane-associated HD superfamily phosphohydrolase